ncbi:hypothetical protein BG011_007757 [Mortierella polycephala]|uniref:DNA repair metallo-beta-lactamase domain-containing protein n=1 Tax=Mortierella polycephala TaxID=41804 RepID=A0A9P6PSN2_9FUNG|nr:hypothetical protein BG011_007757 [Mortierella polycephala]
MSTFDGLIREFPTVAIDNFKSRPGVRVYLLSHVHSDHLTGLVTRAWDAPIYCSQITAKWLPMLATRSKQLAFESGHDHAMERKYAHLAPYLEFAVSDLVNFINRRPRMAHYYIDAWTFGYEEIWIGLAKAFHTKIHVSPYLYELYEIIDDMIYPKVLPHLTLDGTTARFHSCRLGRSCGYGGAGGEHSSARELIRIQPNVSWFSAMLTPERLKQTDSVIAQGQVIGRSIPYSIKEKLPRSIGKKDDLCYLVKLVTPRAIFPCVLHRDSVFSTFYRSNRETIALLSNYLPDPALPTTASEENKSRQHCRNDGITTDFQSFHRAKGFRVLDMNDGILGVASATSSLQSSRQQQQHQEQQRHNTRAIIALTNEDIKAGSKSSAALKQPSPMLSPRSNHLRKKMKKLMRQLRNTASLEEESGLEWKEEDESTLEEGPLSLDLENIERKRKWWMHDNDRGQSTTLEDHTGGGETDSQSISGPPHSNGLVNDASCQEQQGIVSERKDDGECQQEDAPKGWYDQSSLELVPDMLVFDDNAEEQQEGQLSDCAAQSVESKGYVSSRSSSIAASVYSLGEVPVSMAETRHSLGDKVAADVLPMHGSPLIVELTPEAAVDASSSIEFTCDVVSTPSTIADSTIDNA